jgi:hypothetical protein
MPSNRPACLEREDLRAVSMSFVPSGLRAMTALIVLRNKVIKPLLAAARPLRPIRRASNPQPIDTHYRALQLAMSGVFHELGIAA